MNTFLPFPDFAQSAAAIDNDRLNKQRIEIVQMLDAIHQISKADGGWAPPSVRHHPVTEMWENNVLQLITLGWAYNAEWLKRGKNSGGSVEAKFEQHFDWASDGTMDLPDWYGDPHFHEMMRAVLIRKVPEHYRPIFDAAGMTTNEDIEQYYPSRL